MLISIVIPVYNVDRNLLNRCIGSVVEQMDDDIEIVIADDGSETEKSESYRALCDEYAGVKYYRQDNSGPSAARNFGVGKAIGEYVFFLDSDDYITGVCIRQAQDAIRKHHPDIVFGYVYKDLADVEGKKRDVSADVVDELIVDDKEDMASLLNHILGYESSKYVFRDGYLSDGPICRFFRRELFENNLFDVVPKWDEDTLWNIGLLKRCKTAVICKSLWYIYAVREGSITQGYRENCYEEFRYITKRLDDVGGTLWKGSADKGISYRVWHDIFFLSRMLIFNKKNPRAATENYELLKNAIKSESYQKAIRTVNFSNEQRMSRRAVKEFLNLSMKLRCYHIAYLIIKLYISRG